MSIVVKTYLGRKEDDDFEIRRFAVDQGVASNFTYLEEKIRSVYPTLLRESFKLFWKDEEGDMIAFSTDDELMMALGSGGMLRVYIHSEGPTKKPGQVHPNVVCDGCEGSVVGIRYKCAVCPDYDLCSVCEQKGLHSEHFMMRIVKPCSSSFGPFTGAWAHAEARSGEHPPPPGPYGPPPPLGPHGPPPPFCGSFRGRGCERGGGGRRGCERGGSRGRFFRQWMKWMHGTHRMQQQQETSSQQQGGSSQQQQGAAFNPPKEYLRNIGEAVAAALDPLGINFQVHMEHPDGQRETSAGKEQKEDKEKEEEGKKKKVPTATLR